MKTFLRILFFFLLVTQICFAQFEFFNTQPQQKIPSEQLPEVFNVNIDSLMLDSIIVDYWSREQIPGIATLIKKDNEIIWNRNYGFRNLELLLPVEDSTLFLMASISKTIMVTAIMQLWEDGLVSLNGNINNYLPPGFIVTNPYYPNDTITVRMLMTHSASLKDNWDIMDYLWSCGDYTVTYDSFLVNYFTPGAPYYTQQNFYSYRPGQISNYSNAGSCLLALIVQNISGKPYAEYVRENIFIPLSMYSSSYFLTGMDTNKIATPYLTPQLPSCHTGMAYWPIGQLRTNKLELSNFASAYLSNGLFNNIRILDSISISMILSDQLGYRNWIQEIQGLIWMTYSSVFENPNIWGHGGGWYGCLTELVINPDENWEFLFFINVASPPNYSPGIYLTENQLTKYAHLYGNIYSMRSTVDKSYAVQNIDSVLFRAEFSNRFNHTFTPNIIYSNLDSTVIDSTTIFDDGLHGDLLANDGIYGGYIPPISAEDFYSISSSTIDHQNNKYFLTPKNTGFTTSGPLVMDSIYYVHLPAQKRFSTKPYLTNLGNSLPITGVSLKIICNDPWIINFPGVTVNFPTIQPGATIMSTSVVALRYDSTTFPGYFNLKFEIMSGGHCYWKDSLKFEPVIVGVEDEFNEVPTEFLLSQNFPNPFNSSCAIKYSIPKSSQVTLKIFNTLGEEIETLVNEEKPVGTYEVNWNAANLPSGVYFYRLQAGDFVQTRKMILLK